MVKKPKLFQKLRRYKMNKYDDTDYLIEREESIEYEEGSDTNVASIEKRHKKM